MRTYFVSVHIDEAVLKASARRRRAALVAHGCSTYTLGLRKDIPSIVCLCCGLGSSHPDDIENRFCGFCQEFHAEEKEEVTA